MPFSSPDAQPTSQPHNISQTEATPSVDVTETVQPVATKSTEVPPIEAEDANAESFPTEAQIREALCEVNDPEIGMNIIELGLVYDIILDQDQRSVQINMTLTSPGCPLGPEITSAAYLAITRLKGVKDCHVDLVWTPMWNPEVNPTEEAKAALGFW